MRALIQADSNRHCTLKVNNKKNINLWKICHEKKISTKLLHDKCEHNKYECTKDQELSTLLHRRRVESDASCLLTRWQHFLREITSWPPSWKCGAKSKILLRQSMRIYGESIRAKFHHDPIWNDGVYAFWRGRPQQEQQQEQQDE